MGWLFMGGASKSDVIARLTAETDRFRTLKKCVRGNVLYAVVERKGVAGPAGHVLTVSLLRKDTIGWGYKDMDEDMGPYEDSCPPSYFKLLPPPRTEAAAEFRRRCEARAARMSRRPRAGD